MKTREQRIEAFINSLETVESDGTQSFLLPTGQGLLAEQAASNGGNCDNTSESACAGSSNAGDCTNSKGSCAGSSNAGECRSTGIADKPVNVMGSCKKG